MSDQEKTVEGPMARTPDGNMTFTGTLQVGEVHSDELARLRNLLREHEIFRSWLAEDVNKQHAKLLNHQYEGTVIMAEDRLQLLKRIQARYNRIRY